MFRASKRKPMLSYKHRPRKRRWRSGIYGALTSIGMTGNAGPFFFTASIQLAAALM